MPDNPPSMTKKPGLFGLPWWAWGIGAGAFGIAVIVFLRAQSSSSSSNQASAVSPPVGGPSSSGATYPYFMGASQPGNNTTQSQNFGTVVGKAVSAGSWAPGQPDNVTPLFAIPGSDPSKPLNQQPITYAPPNTTFTLTGNPVVGTWAGQEQVFDPILWNGQPYYIAWNEESSRNPATSSGSSSGSGGGGAAPANTATGRMNRLHSMQVTAPYA